MTDNRPLHRLFSPSSPFVVVVVLVALAMAIPPSMAWGGAMYLCRDKSGAMSFTNAPTSDKCREYSLSQRSVFHSSMSRSANPSTYDQDIRLIGRRYQIDPVLIKAIIQTESDFDHRAVSRRGAQGLMQLMPDTARELNVANPFNPRENIDGGTRYLRQLLDNFNGNLTLSLAAYNAGPGLVTRTGGVPEIPETQEYITKVIKQYKKYKRKDGGEGLVVVQE